MSWSSHSTLERAASQSWEVCRSKMPITAVCAVLGATEIMGVPPTSGFMGEWIVFYGALETAIDEGYPPHGDLWTWHAGNGSYNGAVGKLAVFIKSVLHRTFSPIHGARRCVNATSSQLRKSIWFALGAAGILEPTNELSHV